MCGGFHADFAIEWLQSAVLRQSLLCFGCGEAKLITGLAHDHVDLASGAYERLSALLGGVRQFRTPEQIRDALELEPDNDDT